MRIFIFAAAGLCVVTTLSACGQSSKDEKTSAHAAASLPPSASAAPVITAVPGSSAGGGGLPQTPAAGAQTASDSMSSGSAAAPLAAGVLPGPAASTAINPPVNEGVKDIADADRAFLIAHAQANFARQEASRLALERSSSASTKEYARQLLDVGARMDDQINLLAQSKNVALATGDAGPYAFVLSELKRLNGASFDAAYRERIAIGLDHDELLLDQNEVKSGNDVDLKTLAQTSSQTAQAEINAATQIGPPSRSTAANTLSAHHPT